MSLCISLLRHLKGDAPLEASKNLATVNTLVESVFSRTFFDVSTLTLLRVESVIFNPNFCYCCVTSFSCYMSLKNDSR